MATTDDKDPQAPQPAGKKLTAIVGATGAAVLLSLVPLMESGRTVVTQVTPQHTVVITREQPTHYLHAYLDIAGVATVCDGLTQGVTRSTTMSVSQCDAQLDAVLAQTAAAVQKCTPLDKSTFGYQLAAYVDFAYNLGSGAWCKSAAARSVRAGRYLASCDQLLDYDKARVHGRLVPVADLTRRRKRERAYCQTGLTPGSTPATLPARLKGL